MEKADEVFWREFAVILLLLTIFGVAMFFLARAIGGSAFDRAQQTDRAIAERIAPVGKVRVGDPSKTAPAPSTVASVPTTAPSAAASGEGRSGEEVYNAACLACHATGAAGAPKLDDKAAWEPRAASGVDALISSVINGKGAMPPKAGNPTLTEPEIKSAVAFMLEKTGLGAGTGTSAEPAAPRSETTVASTAQTSVPPVATDGRPGEEVYNTACLACHATGAAGAPKLGDKAAWGPRMSAGVDALVASVIKGKGAMPPKGGNATLSDGGTSETRSISWCRRASSGSAVPPSLPEVRAAPTARLCWAISNASCPRCQLRRRPPMRSTTPWKDLPRGRSAELILEPRT